jgi:mannose-1-phosphate guanylyltransferase
MVLPAMVLCAGFGTRLRPLTDAVPKPLLPIGDQPAYVHITRALRAAGFGPVVINTHHGAAAFDGRVPAGIGVSYEKKLLGTAGGVAHARGLLGPGDVLVWNGDIQAQPDLRELVRAHGDRQRSEPSVATLLVVPRPAGRGTVGVDARGSVVRLRGEVFGDEVRGGDYLGIMILDETARGVLPQEGCLVGDLLLPELRARRTVSIAWHDGRWIDIGTPSALLLANRQWLRQRRARVWTAPGTTIDPHALLADTVVAEGGRVIGAGSVTRCLVLPGATLRASAENLIAMADGRLVDAS